MWRSWICFQAVYLFLRHSGSVETLMGFLWFTGRDMFTLGPIDYLWRSIMCGYIRGVGIKIALGNVKRQKRSVTFSGRSDTSSEGASSWPIIQRLILQQHPGGDVNLCRHFVFPPQAPRWFRWRPRTQTTAPTGTAPRWCTASWRASRTSLWTLKQVRIRSTDLPSISRFTRTTWTHFKLF